MDPFWHVTGWRQRETAHGRRNKRTFPVYIGQQLFVLTFSYAFGSVDQSIRAVRQQ